MAERECASALCDEEFVPATSDESARYCSRACFHREPAHADTAPTQEPVRERYVRRWVLRIKWRFKKRESR